MELASPTGPLWAVFLVVFGVLVAVFPERLLVLEALLGMRSWDAPHPSGRYMALRRALAGVSALVGAFFLL